jgi:hypothetical protein
MMITGIYAPVVAVTLVIVASILQVPALFWPSLAILGLVVLAWILAGCWLKYLWPTGIRIDGDGVRIGGVRWAERHQGETRDRLAIVPRQCSWGGVLRIGVVTDPDALKTVRKHASRGVRPTPLGNLAAPFMRAALVILVDCRLADAPSIRPATGFWWRIGNGSGRGFAQPLWVVPTRNPAAVSDTLARLAPGLRPTGTDELLRWSSGSVAARGA